MPEDYQVGVKMRYLFHDGAATLGYLRQGDWRRALAGVADFFRTPEALYRKDDKGGLSGLPPQQPERQMI